MKLPLREPMMALMLSLYCGFNECTVLKNYRTLPVVFTDGIGCKEGYSSFCDYREMGVLIVTSRLSQAKGKRPAAGSAIGEVEFITPRKLNACSLPTGVTICPDCLRSLGLYENILATRYKMSMNRVIKIGSANVASRDGSLINNTVSCYLYSNAEGDLMFLQDSSTKVRYIVGLRGQLVVGFSLDFGKIKRIVDFSPSAVSLSIKQMPQAERELLDEYCSTSAEHTPREQMVWSLIPTFEQFGDQTIVPSKKDSFGFFNAFTIQGLTSGESGEEVDDEQHVPQESAPAPVKTFVFDEYQSTSESGDFEGLASESDDNLKAVEKDGASSGDDELSMLDESSEDEVGCTDGKALAASGEDEGSMLDESSEYDKGMAMRSEDVETAGVSSEESRIQLPENYWFERSIHYKPSTPTGAEISESEEQSMLSKSKEVPMVSESEESLMFSESEDINADGVSDSVKATKCEQGKDSLIVEGALDKKEDDYSIFSFTCFTKKNASIVVVSLGGLYFWIKRPIANNSYDSNPTDDSQI